jgi:hypothetical protein
MVKKIILPKRVRVQKNDVHIKALYELLKNRKFNISNQNLPTFNEHKLFVLNNPYRDWYLIEVNKFFVGTMYLLKDNCIGIYVEEQNKYLIEKTIEWVLRNKKPLSGIKSVRASDFHINIAPNNKIVASVLRKMGATPIQLTYSLKNI